MEWFKKNRKAVVGAAGALLTAMLTLAVDPKVQAVLPQNWQTWLAAGGGTILTLAATYLRRNKLDPSQIATAVVKGDVSVKDVKAVVVKNDPAVVADVGVGTTADLTPPPRRAPHKPPPPEG